MAVVDNCFFNRQRKSVNLRAHVHNNPVSVSDHLSRSTNYRALSITVCNNRAILHDRCGVLNAPRCRR